MTTTPQVRLGAIYPNSEAVSSGKTEDCRANTRPARNLPLAASVARQCGIVPSWPNLQLIRLAIESEADYSDISLANAAALIAAAACEVTIVDPERYSFQAAALLRKSNIVNRFWFEDALWRHKQAYQNMLARLQEQSA